MGKYFKGGETRHLQGVDRILLYSLILAVFVFAMWANFLAQWQPYVRNAGFTTLMLAGLFLMKSPFQGVATKRVAWYDYGLALITLYIGGYIFIHGDRFVDRWPIVDPLSGQEWVLGFLLVLIALEATRRSLGVAFTTLILLLVAYFFLGHRIPGSFSHQPLGLTEFIDYMGYTVEGVFGSIASVAATYVFVFVLFGAFLDKSGAGDFFIDAAKALAGRQRGGPAKVAVISSGLFGTISGSPVSDVVTTGSFTIPMMRKAGYPRAFAGAVEAVASSGGSIMPPVMGSAALLMTEMAGVPLTQVIIAAVIPALLYYVSVFMQVHFRAVKMNLGSHAEEVPTVGQVLMHQGYYIIPFALLVYLLLRGYTPQYAALMSMLLIVVLSWVRKETRMGLFRIFEAIVEGVSRIIPLMAIVTGAGLLVGCLNVTGLGGKLMSLISGLTGGNLLLALVLTAVICIVLGMGMPTAAAYVLTAVITAPALIQLGVPVLQAHFFIVYFTVLSAITPPICVAAYAAASLAQADPIDIGWRAVKLGIAAYIVPFLFVFEPALNLEGSAAAIITASLSALVGVIALGAGIEGVLLGPLSLLERGLVFAAGVLAIIPGLFTDSIGYALLIALLVWQWWGRHRRVQSKEIAS